MITTLEEFTPDTIGKESAFICCDCMEAMKRMPDKCVDLAIVDPPYGIGIGSTMGIGRGGVRTAIRRKLPCTAQRKAITQSNILSRVRRQLPAGRAVFSGAEKSIKRTNYLGRQLLFRSFGPGILSDCVGQGKAKHGPG